MARRTMIDPEETSPAPAAATKRSVGAKLSERLQLGPSPRWRETIPALAGLLAAVAACVILVTIDTLVAKYTSMKPGDLLSFIPLVVAAVAVALALFARDSKREALFSAAIVVGCLTSALHPNPPLWAHAVSVAMAVVPFVLRLAPATRTVLIVPCLVPALIMTGEFASLDLENAIGFAAVVVFLMLLWFAVPHETGWRRVPYLALLGAWVVAAAAVALVVLYSLFTSGISVPDKFPTKSAGGAFGTLLVLAAAIAWPVLLTVLWRSGRARAFALPSVAASEPS